MAYITPDLLGTTAEDNLIAGVSPATRVIAVDLTTSGVITRGTVMSRESDGTYAVLGAGTGTAAGILAQDTEEDDVIAEIYITGFFCRDVLTVADGYELTADDEFNLRQAGPILLTDGI